MSGVKDKSCGAVVFRDDGCVLLIKQRAGHVSFPTGHVVAGEDEHATARREVREETGIEIAIEDGFREVESYTLKNGTPKDVVYFFARPVGGELHAQETEVSSLGWYTIDEAMRKITYKGARNVLRAASQFNERKR